MQSVKYVTVESEEPVDYHNSHWKEEKELGLLLWVCNPSTKAEKGRCTHTHVYLCTPEHEQAHNTQCKKSVLESEGQKVYINSNVGGDFPF